MFSYFEYREAEESVEQSRQVLSLAQRVLVPLLESNDFPENISHLIVATTCPDMLAPSLGQMIVEKFHSVLSECHTIDIVQGCAGGLTALILASQLAELNNSSVIVVQADAARKATSTSKRIHKIFGNGSFACLISYENSNKGLLHYKSRQYKNLSEVVTVKLGHDSDRIIINEIKEIAGDPRKYLGLSMNNKLALKLLRHAEAFYLEFVEQSGPPDMMILHQVNPVIMKHLASVFSKYKITFINFSETTGNCGAASIGVALDKIKDRIQNKKFFLCSFGTGGVITAGLWQN